MKKQLNESERATKLIYEDIGGFISGSNNSWLSDLSNEEEAPAQQAPPTPDIMPTETAAYEEQAGAEEGEEQTEINDAQILDDCRWALIELIKQYNLDSVYAETLLNSINKLEMKVKGVTATPPVTATAPAMVSATPIVSHVDRTKKVISEVKKTRLYEAPTDEEMDNVMCGDKCMQELEKELREVRGSKYGKMFSKIVKKEGYFQVDFTNEKGTYPYAISANDQGGFYVAYHGEKKHEFGTAKEAVLYLLGQAKRNIGAVIEAKLPVRKPKDGTEKTGKKKPKGFKRKDKWAAFDKKTSAGDSQVDDETEEFKPEVDEAKKISKKPVENVKTSKKPFDKFNRKSRPDKCGLPIKTKKPVDDQR